MNKVWTILEKEWAEVFRNRLVVFTVLFMPLVFTALPLIMLSSTRGATGNTAGADLPPSMLQACPADVSMGGCFQIYLVNQFLMLFMLMPLIIPTSIAAYSVVGEKTTRSLEPLLATPISTLELLAGKNLAAVLPAVGATWLGFAIYILGAQILVTEPAVRGALISQMWLLAILVVGPLLAILSVNFALMVSSRVNDPRVAEQLSAVVIVPVLLLLVGQVSGLLLIQPVMVMWFIVILALIDAGAIYLAVRVFDREAILTRWK